MAQQISPWVLLRLGANVLAIESALVRDMLILPACVPIPLSGPDVRGMVTLRNQAVPVVDLRRALGMPSLQDEQQALIATLAERAEDHKRWVAELDEAVTERRPFTLTLDPHACKFGKWYDSFKTSSIVLEGHLKRFDAPHKAIHALGEQVMTLARAGKDADAHALVAQARQTTLASLLQLFAQTPQIFEEMNREMLLVLRDGQQMLGITADSVESVEPLRLDSMAPIELGAGAANGLVCRTAKTARNETLLLVLEGRALLERFSERKAA